MSASHCTEGFSAARGWQSELFSSLSLKSLAPETQRDTGLTQLCYFRLYIKTVSLENQSIKSQCNSGSEEIKRQCLLSLFHFSVIVIQNFTATIKVKTSPKSGGRNLYVDLEIVGNLFLIMKWHLTFICWPFSGARPTGWTSVPVLKSEWTINTKIEAVSCNNPLKPQTISSCSLHQFINHVLWLVNRFPHFNNMFPLFPCILRAVGTLWVLDASLFSIFFFSLDFSAVPGSVWGNQQLKSELCWCTAGTLC